MSVFKSTKEIDKEKHLLLNKTQIYFENNKK